LLLALYYLKRSPLALLKLLPLGLALYKRGRVALLPSKIKGVGAIQKILAASSALELPREKAALEYAEGTVGYRAVGQLPPTRTA
jgi:hypothetical protein